MGDAVEDKTPTNGRADRAVIHDGPLDHRRRTDPTNLYALALRLAERFGFPAVMCLTLMYWVMQREESYRKMAEEAHKEFRAALETNTSAVRSMVHAQNETNVELVHIKQSLDEDRRRN